MALDPVPHRIFASPYKYRGKTRKPSGSSSSRLIDVVVMLKQAGSKVFVACHTTEFGKSHIHIGTSAWHDSKIDGVTLCVTLMK